MAIEDFDVYRITILPAMENKMEYQDLNIYRSISEGLIKKRKFAWNELDKEFTDDGNKSSYKFRGIIINNYIRMNSKK